MLKNRTWLIVATLIIAALISPAHADTVAVPVDAVFGRTRPGAPEKPAVGLTGEALDHIDVDTIFRIEKLDKSYVPQDRGWFASPREW